MIYLGLILILDPLYIQLYSVHQMLNHFLFKEAWNIDYIPPPLKHYLTLLSLPCQLCDRPPTLDPFIVL